MTPLPRWLADDMQLLFEKCPAHLPVVVRLVEKIGPGPRGSALGRCLLQRWKGRRPRFVLEIESGHPRAMTRDILLHEHAHALAYRGTGHGDTWALAYGRCYRAVVES